MSDSPPIGQGCHIVAKNLFICKKLKEIHLFNCEIKDAGARVLFKSLIPHKELSIINLDGNEIGDACLDAIY